MSDKKRKHRLGDRKEGRKLRTLNPITRAMPYIMPRRSDSQNFFTEKLEITAADKFCREQIRAGRDFTDVAVNDDFCSDRNGDFVTYLIIFTEPPGSHRAKSRIQ